MQLLTQPINLAELKSLAQQRFGTMIKAVVDIDKKIIVVDADQEQTLLEQGSQQQHLWGINLYPDIESDDWLEFDSMINLRPSQQNFSRSVEDPKLQAQIRQIVDQLITRTNP